MKLLTLAFLFAFVSCVPEDGFRVNGTIGYIPVTCNAHNHIIAFDTSGSNDNTDPNRARYTQLLEVLRNKKQESDSERYLFVEFKRSNDITVNGGFDSNFKSLSQIINIIEERYQRSRDQGNTPYIRTFQRVADIIDEDSDSLASPMRYSINFFTDGKPCSENDGCESREDEFGPVQTSRILDAISSAKSLEAKPMVAKIRVHTVNYGDLTQLSETILDSMVNIGEGNNVSLGDFSNQSYVDTLSQTSFSCQ